VRNLKVIGNVIFAIQESSDLFNAAFYGKVRSSRLLINLKKLYVDDFNTDEWRELSWLYVKALSSNRQVGTFLDQSVYATIGIQFRVKSFKTVQIKLTHNLNRHRYVAKICNDFFGARIIVSDDLYDSDEFRELLKQLKNQKIISRFYVREDGNYHAIHCYFQSKNYYFPWELQVWPQRNQQNNYQEHARHERERNL